MYVLDGLSCKTGFIPPWKKRTGDEGGSFLHGSKPVAILVVEDNVDDSYLLTRQLARADMEDCVTVIGNGQDALDWLRTTSAPPLAIFVDLHLPGMEGIELIKKIKEDAHLHAVPIIVMTGSLNPNDVETCTKLGVSAYLPKPVALTTFIKIIAHLFPQQA